jgi:hypothetical protein
LGCASPTGRCSTKCCRSAAARAADRLLTAGSGPGFSSVSGGDRARTAFFTLSPRYPFVAPTLTRRIPDRLPPSPDAAIRDSPDAQHSRSPALCALAMMPEAAAHPDGRALQALKPPPSPPPLPPSPPPLLPPTLPPPSSP